MDGPGPQVMTDTARISHHTRVIMHSQSRALALFLPWVATRMLHQCIVAEPQHVH